MADGAKTDRISIFTRKTSLTHKEVSKSLCLLDGGNSIALLHQPLDSVRAQKAPFIGLEGGTTSQVT